MNRRIAGRALLALLPAIGCSGQGSLRLPFQGLSSSAVHRFFPDLDGRENAIRYGRWRALESAWRRGIGREADPELAAAFLSTIHRLPAFPPDARLAAPRFSREAPRSFEALLQGDRLEREIADALASTDVSGSSTKARIETCFTAYRRSSSALSEPPAAEADSTPGDLHTARLLLEGDWLFAQSAEDLDAASFREQRWKVRASVERYDREIESPPDSIAAAWYARVAPEFSQAHSLVAAALDRVTRFRIEVFQALTPADEGSRLERLASVEKRYGLR